MVAVCLQFFTGESMNPEGMVGLLDYREDGITPFMLFFKDGLEIEKWNYICCSPDCCFQNGLQSRLEEHYLASCLNRNIVQFLKYSHYGPQNRSQTWGVNQT